MLTKPLLKKSKRTELVTLTCLCNKTYTTTKTKVNITKICPIQLQTKYTLGRLYTTMEFQTKQIYIANTFFIQQNCQYLFYLPPVPLYHASVQQPLH